MSLKAIASEDTLLQIRTLSATLQGSLDLVEKQFAGVEESLEATLEAKAYAVADLNGQIEAIRAQGIRLQQLCQEQARHNGCFGRICQLFASNGYGFYYESSKTAAAFRNKIVALENRVQQFSMTQLSALQNVGQSFANDYSILKLYRMLVGMNPPSKPYNFHGAIRNRKITQQAAAWANSRGIFPIARSFQRDPWADTMSITSVVRKFQTDRGLGELIGDYKAMLEDRAHYNKSEMQEMFETVYTGLQLAFEANNGDVLRYARSFIDEIYEATPLKEMIRAQRSKIREIIAKCLVQQGDYAGAVEELLVVAHEDVAQATWANDQRVRYMIQEAVITAEPPYSDTLFDKAEAEFMGGCMQNMLPADRRVAFWLTLLLEQPCVAEAEGLAAHIVEMFSARVRNGVLQLPNFLRKVQEYVNTTIRSFNDARGSFFDFYRDENPMRKKTTIEDERALLDAHAQKLLKTFNGAHLVKTGTRLEAVSFDQKRSRLLGLLEQVIAQPGHNEVQTATLQKMKEEVASMQVLSEFIESSTPQLLVTKQIRQMSRPLTQPVVRSTASATTVTTPGDATATGDVPCEGAATQAVVEGLRPPPMVPAPSAPPELGTLGATSSAATSTYPVLPPTLESITSLPQYVYPDPVFTSS